MVGWGGVYGCFWGDGSKVHFGGSFLYVYVGNSQRGGGKTYRAILGGGGEKRTIKCPLQTQFWRPQKVGFVWSVPVSSKKNDIA